MCSFLREGLILDPQKWTFKVKKNLKQNTSAVKFTRDYDKNISFLVIPKSPKLEKKRNDCNGLLKCLTDDAKWLVISFPIAWAIHVSTSSSIVIGKYIFHRKNYLLSSVFTKEFQSNLCRYHVILYKFSTNLSHKYHPSNDPRITFHCQLQNSRYLSTTFGFIRN